MSSISSSNGSASEPDAGLQDVHLGKQVLVVVLGIERSKVRIGVVAGRYRSGGSRTRSRTTLLVRD